VAAGGIISLFSPAPTRRRGNARHALARGSATASGRARKTAICRSGWWAWESLFIVVVCTLVPSFKDQRLGAGLLLVLGFLFVTVSSRLTGRWAVRRIPSPA